MKIMITGGSGMVGRNFLEHQKAGEYRLLSPSRRELDLLDRNAVRNYINGNQPDLIIHAAGRVGGIQANIANPVDFLADNLYMGLNVISSANDAGVSKLINIASSCMYPRLAQNPLTEEAILTGELEPTNEGYALSKIITTRLCEYITKSAKSRAYKTLIPCNLFGRYDDFRPENSHLLPAIIRKIYEAKDNNDTHVEIWGDGTARREFMDAAVLSDFIFYALNNIETLPQNTNIGAGYDYTVSEYYGMVANALDYRGDFIYDRTKPTGMKQKLVDITAIKNLDWEPKININESINFACEYYIKEFRNGI